MGCKLLLVDDEEKMVKYLSRRLEIRGYAVSTASSGEAAVALVKDNEFDVVLLDFLMPDMNGIETLKQIKKIRPAIAVIMISAYSCGKTEKSAKSLGASDFVMKPFDLNNLVGKIEGAAMHRNRYESSADETSTIPGRTPPVE
jgi:two-component system, OmpR family, response regulator